MPIDEGVMTREDRIRALEQHLEFLLSMCRVLPKDRPAPPEHRTELLIALDHADLHIEFVRQIVVTEA